jgi:lysyl-tRNA synthetase class I
MMMIDDFQKDIINPLKEIQENTDKQVEALKEKIQKSLNYYRKIQPKCKGIEQNHTGSKNRNRNNKEITKGINFGDRKPRKEIDASIINRIQDIEERISGAENTIENIDTTVKENTKS